MSSTERVSPAPGAQFVYKGVVHGRSGAWRIVVFEYAQEGVLLCNAIQFYGNTGTTPETREKASRLRERERGGLGVWRVGDVWLFVAVAGLWACGLWPGVDGHVRSGPGVLRVTGVGARGRGDAHAEHRDECVEVEVRVAYMALYGILNI